MITAEIAVLAVLTVAAAIVFTWSHRTINRASKRIAAAEKRIDAAIAQIDAARRRVELAMPVTSQPGTLFGDWLRRSIRISGSGWR